MARPNPPGQLSGASGRLHFAFATPADDGDLRRLLQATPMRGAISVSFTREPDYFQGTGMLGTSDRTLLARDRGRLVATGRCTTRECWLNGEVQRVAYLGELRLATGMQGRWDILYGGYAFLAAEYARNRADYCFTSIIADNTRARRLLERGLRGLPRYRFIGEQMTLLIPTKPCPAPAGYTVTTGAELTAGQLVGFLNTAARERQLATHWTPSNLDTLAGRGLRSEDFIVLRRGAEIVACGGIWDQRSFRQIKITGYTPWLAAIRPVINFLSPLLGQPRLPAPGALLKQAFLSPFSCPPAVLPALIQAARDMAARRGLDCLVFGGSPECPALRGLHGRRYLSRLYRVDWPGVASPACELDDRPCLPDISLL